MGKFIMNGVEYTSSPMNGFPPLIYSDEEREVGIWRDGKPLYQKTWKLSSPLSVQYNTWTDTDIPNTGMQKIIMGCANDEFNNSGVLQSNSFMYLSFAVNAQNYVRVLSARNATITLNYITLLYTKTADTPGSGRYTTYGGLAHHYSTAEKVVGTWIDGKPLYEKTVEIGYLPNSTSTPYPHGISNIKRVVSHSGSAINSSGVYLPLPKVSPSGLQDSVDIAITTSDIVITTGSDRSGYYAYVTIHYTKTTD